MANSFTKKISSGRFLLTITAGACFMTFTATICYILIKLIDQIKVTDVLPYLSAMLLVLSNIFTFYFTKKSENGNSDHGTTK